MVSSTSLNQKKGPRLKVGSTDNTEEGDAVQKRSISASCWLVARTHIGSGAASTYRMKASVPDDVSLHICITSARMTRCGIELQTVSPPTLFACLALYTCLLFRGKSQPDLHPSHHLGCFQFPLILGEDVCSPSLPLSLGTWLSGFERELFLGIPTWFDINSVFYGIKTILDKCQALKSALAIWNKQIIICESNIFRYYSELSTVIAEPLYITATCAHICGHNTIERGLTMYPSKPNHKPLITTDSIETSPVHLQCLTRDSLQGHANGLKTPQTLPFTVLIILVKSGEDEWR